jgi:hypothetical protein
MDGEREECSHCGTHRDQNRPQTLDAASRRANSSGSPASRRSSNEVEKHYDVADDDANQAGNTQEGHEAKRRVRHGRSNQCPADPVGNDGEHNQWLHRILELNQQGKINAGGWDRQDDGETAKAFHLLCLSTTDDDGVPRRQGALNSIDIGLDALKNLRREHSVQRYANHPPRQLVV